MLQISKTLKYRFARILAETIRSRTLPLAKWAFHDVSGDCMLNRPFYNYQLHVDVSRSDTQRLLYLEGKRFIEERLILEPLLKTEMTVADVGANIGYHTLFFAHHVGSHGSVIAFEPDPNNLRELRMNRDANDLDQVCVVESAVGDKTGTVGFQHGLNGTVNEESQTSVPMTTLNSKFSDRSVDLVKVDVEGFEMSVLKGMDEVILRDYPHIFLEAHPNIITKHSHEEILSFLDEYYEDVKVYVRKKDRISKIKYKYLRSQILREVDQEKFVAEYNRGERFWILAKKCR
jgi:FkbM family methyltransferase